MKVKPAELAELVRLLSRMLADTPTANLRSYETARSSDIDRRGQMTDDAVQALRSRFKRAHAAERSNS